MTRARGVGVMACAAWLALVVHAACGGDETDALNAVGEGCLINSDCSSPLVCAFRRCHTQCTETRDCPSGQRCVLAEAPTRVCQLPDEEHCAYSSECPSNEVCGIDGRCRNQCATDRDCVPEQVCVTGTCADVGELTDGGLTALSTGNGPATGQPCSFDSECPDHQVCRDNACLVECNADADCPSGASCDVDTHRCAGAVPCVPGAQLACACPDGGVGAQVCNPDGQSLGPCIPCPLVDGG